MPSTTIPFDPSLVLGINTDPDKLADLEAKAAQEPVKTARLELNAMIVSKRSMDKVLLEMINMNVDQEDIDAFAAEVDTMKTAVAAAAAALAKATSDAQPKVSE